MDAVRGRPVSIERLHCVPTGHPVSWMDQCWDLQDVSELGRPLRSSPEEHLVREGCPQKPIIYSSFKVNKGEKKNYHVLKGTDIKDLPTSYTIEGFKASELIVIGTYVDKNLLPGFKYKVRKNLTEDYLFEGKSMFLENIGQGYGKRLTFQDECLNDSGNFFWSDSRPQGYGFTFQVLNIDDHFEIFNDSTGMAIGKATVSEPASTEDVALCTVVENGGTIRKEVGVHFRCDVLLQAQQNTYIENTQAQGVAILIKERLSTTAKIQSIKLCKFPIENCQLVIKDCENR